MTDNNRRPLTGPQPVDWREFAAMQKDIVAQLLADLARCENALSRANKYGKEADERLAQAEHDRDVLAAEVMAWRESFGKLFDFTHATANQGALTRAKEAK
jgi:hypothetical protein